MSSLDRRKQHVFKPFKFSMFWVIKRLVLRRCGREADLTSYIASFCGEYRWSVMFKHAVKFFQAFLLAPYVNVNNRTITRILDKLMVMCMAIEYTPKYCQVAWRMDLSCAIVLPTAVAYASLLIREDNPIVVISRKAPDDRKIVQQMFDQAHQNGLKTVSEEALVRGNWLVDAQDVDRMEAIKMQTQLMQLGQQSTVEYLMQQWTSAKHRRNNAPTVYCVIDYLRPMFLPNDAPTEETIVVTNDSLTLVGFGMFRDR